jgi:excisionase family DNA binding protein
VSDAGGLEKESAVSDVTGSGDVYTMAEAARLKGVSYHTVSRAVRRGKLPATRLGRMALITSEDLREWRPMRERAPRKYRRREPNPEAAPALLDLASAERVELASRLASLYEALFAVVSEMPREELFDLLADRLAGTLGLRRAAVWLLDDSRGRATRVAAYGPTLLSQADEVSLSDLPILDPARLERAGVQELGERDVSSLLVAPIRVGDRNIGVIVGDRSGELLRLNQGELDLAQAMANVAATAQGGGGRRQVADAA